MRIHREGQDFLLGMGISLILVNILMILVNPKQWKWSVGLSTIIWGFFAAFFRQPQRSTPYAPNSVFSPADGTIVNIERVTENEYLGDERLMVSIFLSVFNVHMNWIPVNGTLKYVQYHEGKYLVAFHPKSSELNERSTVVIDTPTGIPILVRQIAGLLARRIVTYPQIGQGVYAGQELGFIKFGSRVDIFLPVDSHLCVRVYDQVRGGETVLAELTPR